MDFNPEESRAGALDRQVTGAEPLPEPMAADHPFDAEATDEDATGDDIAESASKIEKINEDKEELKSQKVAFDNDTQFAKSEDRNQDVDGLTDFATSRLNKESAEASHYLIHRSSEHKPSRLNHRIYLMMPCLPQAPTHKGERRRNKYKNLPRG